MEFNGIDRCPGCMAEKHGMPVCSHCNWDEQTSQNPPPCLPVGTCLNDQYILGGWLGHGGFGVTYLAWEKHLNTRVALKEYLPRDFSARAADGISVTCFHGEAADIFNYGRRKFLDEARHLARFTEHPGIVTVLSYFEANATAYMVMQYVDGMDLKQFLKQVGGQLQVDVALGIMAPALDALRAVHEAGLLHRDISPDNIYVTNNQRIMLLDFGAARDAMGSHSQSQASIRKPGYSPEEQYRIKGDQGPWTDVYAAAATLYCLITGKTPLDAMERLAEDHLQSPSRLGVAIDTDREAVLMQALAVRAAHRFQDVATFQQALQRLPPPPPPEPISPFRPTPQPAPQPVPDPELPPTPVSPEPPKRPLTAVLLISAILLTAAVGWLLHQRSLEPVSTPTIDIQHAKIAAEEAKRRRLAAERADAAAEADAEAERLRLEAENARRRANEAREARQQASSAAEAMVSSYYDKLDRGDVNGALSAWYSVSNRDALAKAMRRIAKTEVLAVDTTTLAQDRKTAVVEVRVRVRNQGESSSTWAGPIHLKLYNNRWEIDTMRYLSKVQ